jgi:hypothetical protein
MQAVIRSMGLWWPVELDVLEPSLCLVYQQRGQFLCGRLLILPHDFHNHAGRWLARAWVLGMINPSAMLRTDQIVEQVFMAAILPKQTKLGE